MCRIYIRVMLEKKDGDVICVICSGNHDYGHLYCKPCIDHVKMHTSIGKMFIKNYSTASNVRKKIVFIIES